MREKTGEQEKRRAAVRAAAAAAAAATTGATATTDPNSGDGSEGRRTVNECTSKAAHTGDRRMRGEGDTGQAGKCNAAAASTQASTREHRAQRSQAWLPTGAREDAGNAHACCERTRSCGHTTRQEWRGGGNSDAARGRKVTAEQPAAMTGGRDMYSSSGAKSESGDGTSGSGSSNSKRNVDSRHGSTDSSPTASSALGGASKGRPPGRSNEHTRTCSVDKAARQKKHE